MESLLLISSKDLSKHSDIVGNTNILIKSKDENKGSPFTIKINWSLFFSKKMYFRIINLRLNFIYKIIHYKAYKRSQIRY